MAIYSGSGNFTRFQEIVSTQPGQWKKKLDEMYKNEPDVAIAAWTLISSMEDLDIEPVSYTHLTLPTRLSV